MTIDSLPSGIIPTGPQDGRIRATSAPNSGLVAGHNPQDAYSTAPSGLLANANHRATARWPEPTVFKCSWCDQSEQMAFAHQAQKFAVCFPCLVKSLEATLGPRKTQ